MVARVLTRATEFEVRAALGANRWRQFGLLWMENALIAAVGAAGGILLTLGSIDALTRSSVISATIAEFSCPGMTTVSRAIRRTSNPSLVVAGT